MTEINANTQARATLTAGELYKLNFFKQVREATFAIDGDVTVAIAKNRVITGINDVLSKTINANRPIYTATVPNNEVLDYVYVVSDVEVVLQWDTVII